MTALRSILFNIAFFGWSALIMIAGLPLLAIGPEPIYGLGRSWARGMSWLLAVVVGLRHEIRGQERLPSEPVIAAVKHQSTWETLACALLFKQPAYVVKRELIFVPILGWLLLRAGMITVDRRAGGAALRRMLRHAGRHKAAGHTILIFPEGTRTPPGMRRPYQPGIAALYERLALPVVPIALNSGLYWGRRSFAKRPGTIVLEILPAIQPGLPRAAFMAQLEQAIEGASDALARAAPELNWTAVSGR